MSTTPQTFGSALKTPWALVVFGSNAPIGKRPGTTVAYLTDDEGDHYLGGLVGFYRKRATLKLVDGRYVTTDPGDPRACWHYRYQHARRIPKSELLHVFPHTDKSKWGGPTEADVRRARKALPVTTGDDHQEVAA